MKHRYLAIIFILAFPLLAGCGQSANTDEPPEIAYGQDVCQRCGMIISEEKFAAAYWTEAGEARRFDDIGGMLAFITEESEDASSYWVHDFSSGEWIRAEEAFYLLDSELMTPMGFGIAAFADEDQALALAHGQENAAIMRFAQLLEKGISLPADVHSHENDGG